MSSRRAIASPGIVIAALIAQIFPLLMFPLESFSPKSQEWWLPMLLAVMVLVANVELIARRSDKPWPWYLLSFAQGLNIISRLMMIWPDRCQLGLHHPVCRRHAAVRRDAVVLGTARRARRPAQEVSASRFASMSYDR
jgi:hypothetical protein